MSVIEVQRLSSNKDTPNLLTRFRFVLRSLPTSVLRLHSIEGAFVLSQAYEEHIGFAFLPVYILMLSSFQLFDCFKLVLNEASSLTNATG